LGALHRIKSAGVRPCVFPFGLRAGATWYPVDVSLFDPVSLLDDDPAILRYPSVLLESLRDGWAAALELLEDTALDLVPAHASELGGHLARFDDLGQGLVDARLFDGTHPLFTGRPQSAAGRLRFVGDVVLGLLARGCARRAGSELTALRETIDVIGARLALPPPTVGRLKGARAVEHLAVSWPFQVRAASYYDGCVPPYDHLPSAPPPLPPPPLPTWTTPPPPVSVAVPPPLPRGAWTLPHPFDEGSASDEHEERAPADSAPAEGEPAESTAADSAAAESGPDGITGDDVESTPRPPPDSQVESGDVDDAPAGSVREPEQGLGAPVAAAALESLVVTVRDLEPVDDEPMPEQASLVTIPLFEREVVRLFGELALLAYEAGRMFGARDATARRIVRELRRIEHPALMDALLGDGVRGVRVDRALMRMVAEAQGLLEEWRAHVEGEGELLEVEVRALREALEERALAICAATAAAAAAIGLAEEAWGDYWAGLAEDADDERIAYES
jgi:hypothetical protein